MEMLEWEGKLTLVTSIFFEHHFFIMYVLEHHMSSTNM